MADVERGAQNEPVDGQRSRNSIEADVITSLQVVFQAGPKARPAKHADEPFDEFFVDIRDAFRFREHFMLRQPSQQEDDVSAVGSFFLVVGSPENRPALRVEYE